VPTFRIRRPVKSPVRPLRPRVRASTAGAGYFETPIGFVIAFVIGFVIAFITGFVIAFITGFGKADR